LTQNIFHRILLKKRFSFFTFVLIIISSTSYAQELKSKEFRNKLNLAIGHAHPTQWVDANTGEKQKKILPAWALDYDYFISEKWLIGFHTDIVVESFEIENFENKIIKRNYPLTGTLVLSRKITEELGVQLGTGLEYADKESYGLLRLGFDYGWKIRDDFELSALFNYDYKIEGYQTFMIGLGVSKLW
jgi:hypothetical protein